MERDDERTIITSSDFSEATVREVGHIGKDCLGPSRETHQATHTVNGKKYKFIKTTFIKKIFSSKSNFIKIQFHQNPISSKSNFIKNQFHQKTNFIQKPLSSNAKFIKDHFHQNHFHQNHSHQKPLSSLILLKGDRTKHALGDNNNIVRISVKATLSQKHGLCPPFGFQQAFMWSIAGRRPAMLHMKVC